MMSANISFALLLWIAVAFAFGAIIGFTFRSRQISKSKRRILELETEMVENHAEILSLHKSQAAKQVTFPKVPVISLQIADAASNVKVQAKG